MGEIPQWVRMAFIAAALTCLCMSVMAQAQEAPTELQSPADQCGVYTLPDERQACYQEYIAARLYDQATDPTRVAVSEAFPVLAVVTMAFLAWKVAGN